MNNSRSIVSRVFAGQGMTGGLPEISFFIPLPDSFIDGLIQVPVHPAVRTHFHKKNSQAGILAQRQACLTCQRHIFQKLTQYFQTCRTGFGFKGVFKSL